MDAALGALELMWRDVTELATHDWIGRVALTGFALLPTVSTLLVSRGRRLAWLPLGISIGMVAVWFLYYATEWFQPIGGPNGFGAAVLAFGIGWMIALWQLVQDQSG